MTKRCAFCGRTRFGLVRRTGLYFRGFFIVEQQFCSAEHKRKYELERAQQERNSAIRKWLTSAITRSE